MIFLLTAVVGSALAAAVGMAFVVAAFLAFVAVIFAPAVVPDGVGEAIEDSYGMMGIVALDHEFTADRASLGGLVPYDDAEAGAGMQSRREGIADQLPVGIPAFEFDALDVELTVAGVADGEGALGAAAGFDSAEAERAGDDDVAVRGEAGDVDGFGGVCRIVAHHGDDAGLVANAGGLEADGRLERDSGSDGERVGEDFWRDELGGIGVDRGDGERAWAGVAKGERLVGEGVDAGVSEVALVRDHQS